jgi:hypothetical protein
MFGDSVLGEHVALYMLGTQDLGSGQYSARRACANSEALLHKHMTRRPKEL